MTKVVDVRNPSSPLSKAHVSTLQAMFPTSPQLPNAHLGQYTNAEVAVLMKSVVDDIKTGNPDYPNFDPNFGGSPDLSKVEKAADGTLVWNHYSPAPGSPGTPYAYGEAAAKQVVTVPSEGPKSSGMGSTKSPSDSARQVATQFPGDGETIAGNLQAGKSGATP